MAKYRITIENLEGGTSDVTPIECDGFVVLGDRRNGPLNVTCHDMARIDIACALASFPETYAAAILAKGVLESEEGYRLVEKREEGYN